MTPDEFLITLPLMIIAGFLFWLLSLYRKDVSVVDTLWSLFFLIAVLYYAHQSSELHQRASIMLWLVAIWSLRLAIYITLRHWGKPEDSRYASIRDRHSPGFEFKSLYMIFLFQALVAWIVSLPVYGAFSDDSPIGHMDYLGISFWLVGMFFESVSDYQLWKFKRKNENRGKLFTGGLWKYSRHPNYFGECLIWWGFFMLSISGENWWSIISPLLMTFLLLRFSGVILLESAMGSRDGFRDYQSTTSAFIPWFPDRK